MILMVVFRLFFSASKYLGNSDDDGEDNSDEDKPIESGDDSADTNDVVEKGGDGERMTLIIENTSVDQLIKIFESK